MNNLLSRFRLPSFESMASAIRRTFDEFDFNSIETKLNEFGNDIERSFNRLKKRIKNLTDRFIVEVPFDRETQRLSFSIENNVIEIRTETQTETTHSVSTTTTSIPESVNTDTLMQKYDAETKKMMFIFFKWNAKVEDETEENVELEDTVETHTNTTVESAPEVTVTSTVDVTETDTTNKENAESSKDNLLETILAMHEQGYSYRKIASEVGMSDKTVARWIKKAKQN